MVIGLVGCVGSQESEEYSPPYRSQSSTINLTANQTSIMSKRSFVTINGSVNSSHEIKSIYYELYNENNERVDYASNKTSITANYNDRNWEFEDLAIWGGKNIVRIIANDVAGETTHVDIYVTYDMGNPYYGIDKEAEVYDEETEIYYVNNQIRITFDYDVPEDKMWEIVDSFGGTVVGQSFYSSIDVKISPRTLKEIKSLVEQLEELEEVSFAFELPVLEFDPMPISRNATSSLAVKNATWGKDAIQLKDAFKHPDLNLRSGIRIGIIDDGFEVSSKDLKRMTILPNRAENTVASHGTTVAGIIASRSSQYNKKGISADYSGLLCVDYTWKWAEKTSRQRTDRIFDALKWTIEQGAKIVNFSIGYSNGIENGQVTMPNDELAYHRKKLLKLWNLY